MKRVLFFVVVGLAACGAVGIGGFCLGRWAVRRAWRSERAGLEAQIRDLDEELKALGPVVEKKRTARRQQQARERAMMIQLLRSRGMIPPRGRPSRPSAAGTRPAGRPRPPSTSNPAPAAPNPEP